jgi:hypothetical protein
MAIDNTHTKYLKGRDKSAWNKFAEAVESQRKLSGTLDGENIKE